MSEAFFFFGSLRDPLILEAVLGRKPANLRNKPGWLDGHRIERAKGYTFPLLLPDPGSAAEGVLTWGLSSEDCGRIAYFEDSEYEKVKKSVQGPGGTIEAWVYVGSDKLSSSGEL